MGKQDDVLHCLSLWPRNLIWQSEPGFVFYTLVFWDHHVNLYIYVKVLSHYPPVSGACI